MNKQQQAYGYGNGQQADVPGYCCFHPREVGVGVCAHCLKDRLLLLLAAANNNKIDDDARRKSRSRSRSISLPKVFALGSSFLQRLDSRHHRGRGRDNNCYSDDDDATASVASLDGTIPSICSLLVSCLLARSMIQWPGGCEKKKIPSSPSNSRTTARRRGTARASTRRQLPRGRRRRRPW
ncbi:uncharacterized protein LOC100276810 isoform 2 [Zea mays]|uniref:Uncharacterized protein n=1 Tax=Zea mays TaxID=4577 RepID=A0A804MD20_MAIZE|nr:uncharacterized protein LOC100276810 isoform 2 [Zea mays]